MMQLTGLIGEMDPAPATKKTILTLGPTQLECDTVVGDNLHVTSPIKNSKEILLLGVCQGNKWEDPFLYGMGYVGWD